MNPDHEKLCGSPEWAADLRAQILPVVTAGVSLGKDMLEIGPGPGAATAWLQERVAHLTVLEADEAAATRLAARYPDSNVTVDIGDARQMPYGDESFDSVGSFTMLHHVPTAAAQYQNLAEALRVLRPGGWLAGSDSLASNGLHHFHEGDTYNPIEPGTVLSRLQTIGFDKLTIMVDGILKFVAHKPAEDADGDEDSDTEEAEDAA
jgi:SAM-dependent methyltransferase